MTGNEIRETFLDYFERHGHTRVRSSPLLPANDPTLLFTNAGMNQFKDVFVGVEKREYMRACSSQKCVRAGGKHNDLDEVGKTARHQTFFEMLGNFSFGDYFKEDAIKFAWGFLVDELKMDPQRLWFSVFGGDDEVAADEDAAGFWEQVGAPRERILRFGRKDNFWQMGETGPCGPCSEIHYYLGEHPENPEFNRADLVNGPGDTTMEIWNLVFMQYNRIEEAPGSYKLEPLPKPSVDTGLGLERTAVVMQGKYSNYDTDLLRPIVEFTARLAGRHYEPETQEGFAMRVIADHSRATAFLIGDGVLPGNEGRNYVLRKIMRRAIRQGIRTLGFEGLFFSKVTDFVVQQMKSAYPELEVQSSFIEKMVQIEERRFASTMSVGLQKLEELIGSSKNKTVSLRDLSRLKDTFGLDTDLIFVELIERDFNVFDEMLNDTHKLVQEQPLIVSYNTPIGTNHTIVTQHPGLTRDQNTGVYYSTEEKFSELMDREIKVLQRSDATIQKKTQKINPIYVALSRRHDTKTKFKGYESTMIEDSRIVAIINTDQEVQSLRWGDEGEIVLDQTPFYAEAGGQVGDTGILFVPDPILGSPDKETVFETLLGLGGTAIASVVDTYSPAQGLIVHKVKVEKGTLKVGDIVTAVVYVEKRDATRRNHTATHLMHAALREVLGTHVKQAGSVVAPTYLRFDFSHYQPLTKTEIEEIENLVNYHILRNEPVQTDEMAIEEAMHSGAMALFGEKYGEKVRVLSIRGVDDIFSKELCGGTHVRATGDIGVFKILGDESIASGVRRIRAVTGMDAFKRFREDEVLIDQVAGGLKTSRAELATVIGKLQDELKKTRREADELRMKIASGALGSSSVNGGDNDGAREVAGVKVLTHDASGLDSAGMRQLSDTLLARIKSGVVVLGRSGDGKVSLIVRTSDDLTSRVPAGKVIKELAPIVGGKGGGKADMAEGGGALPEKLGEALEASYAVIAGLLG